MWSDPIENAVNRGENIEKARELGISLEKHLHNLYIDNLQKNEKIEKHIPVVDICPKNKTTCLIYDFFINLFKKNKEI